MKPVTMIWTLLLILIGILAYPLLSQSAEKGLVAHWAFEDKKGETASDASGNGHDGKLLGDPQWTDGYFGGGLEFDQVGDEVNIPFHKNLNLDTFTVTAWAHVEPLGVVGYRAVISSRDEPPISGYIIYAAPNNTWQFWTGIGNQWRAITGPLIHLGEWEHLAGTYAKGKQAFYVNGELVGEVDAAPTFNTKQAFLVGAGANERDPHEYLFNGKIDEVRVYDHKLSADEVSLVMENDILPVEPSGKLATTWAKLKAK